MKALYEVYINSFKHLDGKKVISDQIFSIVASIYAKTNKIEKQSLAQALQGHNLKSLELPPTRNKNLSQTSIDFICKNP